MAWFRRSLRSIFRFWRHNRALFLFFKRRYSSPGKYLRIAISYCLVTDSMLILKSPICTISSCSSIACIFSVCFCLLYWMHGGSLAMNSRDGYKTTGILRLRRLLTFTYAIPSWFAKTFEESIFESGKAESDWTWDSCNLMVFLSIFWRFNGFLNIARSELD